MGNIGLLLGLGQVARETPAEERHDDIPFQCSDGYMGRTAEFICYGNSQVFGICFNCPANEYNLGRGSQVLEILKMLH